MRSEVKSGAIWGYVNMVANILVAFIYTPFMLRCIGQSEYGLYSLVASVTAYLSVLDMGFGNAMIRFVSRSMAKNDKNKENEINGLFLFLYSVIGIITVIIGLVLLFNIDRIFPALTPEELSKAKIIMAILVGSVAISFPMSIFDSYIMACEKFTFLKILALIKTVATALIMWPLLLMGYKAITMVVVSTLLGLAYNFAAIFACFFKLNMKLRFSFKQFDNALFKEIMAYSSMIFLGLIVDVVFNNTDQVILGSICGTIAVSIYAVATKIISMNMTLSTTIGGLFLPKVTKMLEEKESDRKISDLFIRVSRIQIYLMMLVLFGVLVFGRQFFNIWVGPDYASAYYIVLIIIAPSVVPLTQNVAISIIQAKNKHQFRAVVYLLIAILNIAISIPLARRYQGVGAAIGTAFANLLGQIITMNIFYYKEIHLDIPQYWKNFIGFGLKIATLSAVFMILIRSISFGWIELMGGVLLFTICYIVITYISMNKEERGYLTGIKRKIVHTKG